MGQAFDDVHAVYCYFGSGILLSGVSRPKAWRKRMISFLADGDQEDLRPAGLVHEERLFVGRDGQRRPMHFQSDEIVLYGHGECE